MVELPISRLMPLQPYLASLKVIKHLNGGGPRPAIRLHIGVPLLPHARYHAGDSERLHKLLVCAGARSLHAIGSVI